MSSSIILRTLSIVVLLHFAPLAPAAEDGATPAACAVHLGESGAELQYRAVRSAEAKDSYFQTRDWTKGAGFMMFPNNRVVGHYGDHFFDVVMPVGIKGQGPSTTFVWEITELNIAVELMPEFHKAHDPFRDLFGEVRELGTDRSLKDLFFLRNPQMVDPRAAVASLATDIRAWIKAGHLDFAFELSKRLERDVAGLAPQPIDLDED